MTSRSRAGGQIEMLPKLRRRGRHPDRGVGRGEAEAEEVMAPQTKRSLLILAVVLGGFCLFALVAGIGDPPGMIIGAGIGGIAGAVAMLPERLFRRRRQDPT